MESGKPENTFNKIYVLVGSSMIQIKAKQAQRTKNLQATSYGRLQA